jgi:thymidylate synthase
MIGDNYKGPVPGVQSNFYYSHQVVNGNTIAEVHRNALYEIIWNRFNVMSVTEDGEKILECGPRTYVVRDITKDRFWDLLPMSERFLDEYTAKFLNGYMCVNNFEYDYHTRLYHYNHAQDNDIDQIAEIQNKLIKNINTRRAVAVTWKPDVDNSRKDVPCLQYIQFVVVGDTMHMNVLFRSNDMLSAFASNAYALTTLQKHVCDYVSRSINKKLNYGFYNHSAICPHIYYVRDGQECGSVVDYFHNKGMI